MFSKLSPSGFARLKKKIFSRKRFFHFFDRMTRRNDSFLSNCIYSPSQWFGRSLATIWDHRRSLMSFLPAPVIESATSGHGRRTCPLCSFHHWFRLWFGHFFLFIFFCISCFFFNFGTGLFVVRNWLIFGLWVFFPFDIHKLLIRYVTFH